MDTNMSKNDEKDLESFMQEIAAIDNASAEVASGDSLDLDDLMPDLDDINDEISDVSSVIEDEEETDVTSDYKTARNNLHWLLDVNKTMIINNAKMAKATTHPKTFETHQKMVETHMKLSESLLNLSPKLSEGTVKARTVRTTKILPDNDHIDGECVEVNENVKITRRPTQSAVFAAIAHAKKLEEENGTVLSSSEMAELAVQMHEKEQEKERKDTEE